MGEIIFLLILIVGGVFLFITSLDYSSVEFLDAYVGPALFPQIIISIIILAAVALLIKIIVMKKKPDFVFIELFKGNRLIFGIFIIAFVLILDMFGFVASTILFLTVTTSFFTYVQFGKIEKIRLILNVVGICVFAVGIYLIFSQLIGLQLPIGKLWV